MKVKKAKKVTAVRPRWHFGRLKVWTDVGGAARLVNGRGWFIGPEGRGHDIATVHLTASQDEAAQETHARMMTAAPELLTACERALEFVRATCRLLDGVHGVHAANVAETLTAAIVKATEGKSC